MKLEMNQLLKTSLKSPKCSSLETKDTGVKYIPMPFESNGPHNHDWYKQTSFVIDGKKYNFGGFKDACDGIYISSVVGYTWYNIEIEEGHEKSKIFVIVDKNYHETTNVKTRNDLFTYNGQSIFKFQRGFSMHNLGHEFGRPRYIVFQNYNGTQSIVSEREGSIRVSVCGQNEFKDVFVYGGTHEDPRIIITFLNDEKVSFEDPRINGSDYVYR